MPRSTDALVGQLYSGEPTAFRSTANHGRKKKLMPASRSVAMPPTVFAGRLMEANELAQQIDAAVTRTDSPASKSTLLLTVDVQVACRTTIGCSSAR